MKTSSDSWTSTHDLALIFIALAYGTDHILADEELEATIEAVQRWQTEGDRADAQELVMEVLAVYLEGNADAEVVRSINSLRRVLSEAERQRALEDVVKIAESDGIYLGSERSLVAILANAWGVKEGTDTESTVDETGWSVMHDVGLMYVAVAHGGDSDLSDSEIHAMIGRLSQWQPELEEQGVRSILRKAIKFYSTQPGKSDFARSVDSIGRSFPVPQRIAVLDDLMFIAEADGAANEHEREMIATLSKVWGVPVRLNGDG